MAGLWSFAGLGWRELGERVWAELSEDSILGRAAQLSFYFLLSIFPMFLILLAALTQVFGEGSVLRAALVRYFSALAPDTSSDLVSGILEQMAQGIGGGGLTFALIVALWASSSGMVAIMSALNDAYDVKETRTWWKARIVAVVLTIMLIVLIGSALLLVTYGAQIAGAVAANLGFGTTFTTLWRILQWPVLLAFVLLAFNLLYLYAPNLKHWDWHWLMPGTVVGVGLWLLASYGFNLYVTYLGSYTLTYGSIGTVVVLLLWFYVTGISILIGAQVNSAIEDASGKIGGPESDAKRKPDKQ